MPPRKPIPRRSVSDDAAVEAGLFDDDNSDFSLPQDVEGQPETAVAQLVEEPLFGTLLQRAVRKVDPDDAVLLDYARVVAPQLSRLLAHKTAKGGDFVLDRAAQGISAAELARYGHDQSMRAHLINGLFPVATIARTLLRWEVGRFRIYFDETAYRLFCAGYTLHDWLKLPEVDQQLEALGLRHDTVNPALHFTHVVSIIADWCLRLGLDRFLEPVGPFDGLLPELILIASNTQVKWGTMRNLSALPQLDPARQHKVLLATDLCTLADYLAYLGRTPIQAARDTAIGAQLQMLSNGTARLSYHHIADVRGVLTNLINNAAVDAYHNDQRIPLLYAPTGVVYLEQKAASQKTPDVSDVANATIARIQAICRSRLASDLVGFSRDGKGLKYAPFYDLFFTPRQLAPVIAKAAHVRTVTNKTGTAATRYAKMLDKDMVPAGGSVEQLPVDKSVDMLAEGVAKLEQLMIETTPAQDTVQWFLNRLAVGDIATQVREIPRRANMGGVPYQWYYAAGVAHQRNPGLSPDEWNERLHMLAREASAILPDTITASGWDELRAYIMANLRFERAAPAGDQALHMAERELAQYISARRLRNATQVCSLCSSSFSVREQRESGILFAPMVYTNKQPLHGNKAIRNICAICEMEMMLRQVLMNNSAATGKRFEGRRLRYLFFYPTYFFTPETLLVLREVYLQLKQTRFTVLRRLLMPENNDAEPRANLALEVFQQIEQLFLDPTLPDRPNEDRLFRMRFSENEPVSFGVLGIPPASREAKDAEAWVHPAFLALVLPLLLDVKVVASESMLPLFNEATELPETVAFDGAHSFVAYLSPESRLNLDRVGPTLQRLTVAYLIHLDGNAGVGRAGYDYRWQDIPALARNLATSPLYAFHYLKKGMRQESNEAISGYKASIYNDLVSHYLPKGAIAMSHARELTLRYRRFYRHRKGRMNSNAILRPVSEAAKALLAADLRLFDDDEALLEAVRSRLEKFVERVAKNKADGTIPNWLYANLTNHEAALDAAVDDFARYFVEAIYRDVFQRDRAALAGKQLNLLKNACESIYMAEQRREWRERNEQPEDKHSDESE